MLDLLTDVSLDQFVAPGSVGAAMVALFVANNARVKKNGGGLSQIERSVIKMVTTLDFILDELREQRRQRE